MTQFFEQTLVNIIERTSNTSQMPDMAIQMFNMVIERTNIASEMTYIAS